MNENGSAAAPLVTVVTATYNRCSDVVSLLSQIALLNYAAERLQVVVVDNGSTDGTADRVRQDFPTTMVIENSQNLGTAAGFNVGLKHALGSEPRPKYIWLLDSDVILEPASLAPLVAAMEQDSRIGIAGSPVYDPRERDRLVAAGLRVELDSGKISFVIPEAGHSQELIDVELVAACSLLVRSEPCLHVGLWDEQLRLYWGDTDWCVRFLRAGYRVVCHRDSHVWHRDWTDVDRGFFTPVYLHDHVRGALLFLTRHGSPASARRLILHSYLRAAVEQLTMRLAFARGYEWAIRDFLQASFTQRDFETIVGDPLLPNLEAVVAEIERCIPPSRHLTVTGACPPQVMVDLQNMLNVRYASVEWNESPSGKKQAGLRDWIAQFFELLAGLLKWPLRHDLLVTQLARPRLSHLTAARYTVFVDAQGRGLIYENKLVAGFSRLLMTMAQGLRIAYRDLPRAIKNSRPLQQAIHAVDASKNSPAADSFAAEPKQLASLDR